MVNILELAKLANHIYTPSAVNKTDKITPYTNKSTIRSNSGNHWFYLKDIVPDMKPTNSDYCQLYLKFNCGQATDAVIAIRGSQSKCDYQTDYNSWLKSILNKNEQEKTPEPYYSQTLAYSVVARDYLQRHYPILTNKVIYTGHSLGGAVAKLLVLRGGILQPAVGFNAPGIAEMPNTNLARANYITNVNAKYDLIHFAGTSVGKQLLVEIPEKEEMAKHIFKQFSPHNHYQYKQHSTWSHIKTSTEIIEVASAQHTILNMISSLQLNVNLAVAHTVI